MKSGRTLEGPRRAGDSRTESNISPLRPLLRWVVWMTARSLTRLLYRIRVEGANNLPATGGALLVSNHLSMVDAFILGAASGRFVRFLMYQGHYDKPFI